MDGELIDGARSQYALSTGKADSKQSSRNGGLYNIDLHMHITIYPCFDYISNCANAKGEEQRGLCDH